MYPCELHELIQLTYDFRINRYRSHATYVPGMQVQQRRRSQEEQRLVESCPSFLAVLEVPQHLLLPICNWRTDLMKTGFIIYLNNKKTKEIRKAVELNHSVKQLSKQPTAVV